MRPTAKPKRCEVCGWDADRCTGQAHPEEPARTRAWTRPEWERYQRTGKVPAWDTTSRTQ